MRTDVHSPSVFDPADYEVIDYLDNKPPEPEMGYGTLGMAAWQAAREDWQRHIFSHFPDWKAGSEDSDHRSIFQCNHCGHQHIRYVAVVLHKPTGARLAFGEICANRADLEGRSEFKAKQARGRREAAQRRAERDAWYADHAELVDWLSGKQESRKCHEFLLEMWDALHRKGWLSENQTAALERWKVRDDEWDAKRKAQNEADAKDAAPFAEGRQAVTGTVISTKLQSSQFGETLKMLVKLDDGNKVWGTVPNSLTSWENPDPKGKRVHFAATFERSKDDEHFGFFKRPSGATIIEAA